MQRYAERYWKLKGDPSWPLHVAQPFPCHIFILFERTVCHKCCCFFMPIHNTPLFYAIWPCVCSLLPPSHHFHFMLRCSLEPNPPSRPCFCGNLLPKKNWCNHAVKTSSRKLPIFSQPKEGIKIFQPLRTIRF